MTTALAVAALLLVTSCGGDDEGADEETTPTSTGPTVPEGITPPGETFALGEPATVVFKGNPQRTSRIELSVTKVRQGEVKDLSRFRLDKDIRKSSVYYVDAKVRNVGDGDLSGQALTLFGKVSDQLVVPPAVFGSPFPRCNYHEFPKQFTGKKSTHVCLVMFAPDHGQISEIQWRGADSEPIAWVLR